MRRGESLSATLSLKDAALRVWDVLVIGAGPAGALTALLCSRGGLSVQLVERASFPRDKVCGGCLNRGALETLRAAGLEDLPDRLRAPRLNRMKLFTGGRVATIPLPEGRAVSRAALDAQLVREAVAAGAHFLPATRAALLEQNSSAAFRCVTLRQPDVTGTARARVVVVADGLAGTALAGNPRFAVRQATDARIGAGCLLDETPAGYRAGTIFMATGRGGYVGLVQVEDGRLAVAAALDATWARACGGLGPAAVAILRKSAMLNLNVPGLAAANWRGTPPLTRRRMCVADRRLFVAGDAAGYVEPFTGEGMALALASARAVSDLAAEAAGAWRDELARQWTSIVTGGGDPWRRRRACWAVSRLVRRMGLVRPAVNLLASVPRLVAPLVRHINSPIAGLRGSAQLSSVPRA